MTVSLSLQHTTYSPVCFLGWLPYLGPGAYLSFQIVYAFLILRPALISASRTVVVVSVTTHMPSTELPRLPHVCQFFHPSSLPCLLLPKLP